MYSRHHPNPNTDFIEKNHSDSESDNEHNHTLDQDLNNSKQKKGITIFRPNKPTTSKAPLVTAGTNTRKSKSILKVSRTFDKSSFDDIIQSKGQFFQDRGHPHMEHSEISEIEKIESVINRSDDQIREVSPREERSPSFRPPSKTGGFGTMSRFSPQKEQDSIDMMSSQTSGYDRVVDRKDTEDIKSVPENRSSKGSPPSMPGIDSADAVRSQQQSERGGYNTETPGFRREKVVKTTESGSNNPTSMSAIHADDFLPPPPLLFNNRDSKHSNSDLAEIFAKKISESSISRKHIKRATFVSSDPKNNHIIPAYTHYVLDENVNQQQVYMPHLADREITDAFATLDMNKDGYITADEIAYFLEVLEENASEAEIEEMIRMVDYEGTGRVRYEEFYKLATGKNLNPIGQAYPPTLDLFEKKNGIGFEIRRTKKIDGLESSSPVNRNFRPLVSRDTPAPLEIHSYSRGQGKIDSKLSKLPRLGDLGDEETKHIKTDKDERDSYFKGFIRQAGLNSKTYMERYHKVEFSNDQRVSKATYKDFLSFFAIDDQDVTKKVFSIISKDRNHLDMRQVMIALSLYLDFTVDEKIGLAYNLYDPDGRDGYILYNELMKIFKMFQLGEEHKKIERKIKTSLNWEWKSIMPEDSIPKEDFIMICKNYPDLFPSNS